MSKLLTKRLAVLGQEALKRTFASSLIYTLKGIKTLTEEDCQNMIAEVEDFATSSIELRFFNLQLEEVNKEILKLNLISSIYAIGIAKKMKKALTIALEETPFRLNNIWRTYCNSYAEILLNYGAGVILNKENGFNEETIRFFLKNPEKTLGAALINDIPPLLENDYIYLNNCGFNQQTDWHRATFLDSYFLALTSYRNVIQKLDLAKAFNLSLIDC